MSESTTSAASRAVSTAATNLEKEIGRRQLELEQETANVERRVAELGPDRAAHDLNLRDARQVLKEMQDKINELVEKRGTV